MSGPVALIVNPRATKASPRLRERVARALAPHGLEWSLVTEAPGDAARLALRVAGEGAATVVTVGGDGTVADVAGALAGGPVVLAPLPGGNANVFARALGWPASVDDAIAVLTRAMERPRVREASLGLLHADGEPRVFAINCGVGLDAATVEWIEARPRTKRRLRHAGFVLGAAVAAVRSRRLPRLTVEVAGAGGAEAGPGAVAVLVACGTPYTYLGRRPLDLAPGAAFDGHLAWVAITRARPHELGRLAALALRGRELPLDGPALRGGRAPAGLVIRSPEPAPLQADGEPLGRHREVRVTPGPVLRVVDPRPSPRLNSDGDRTI
ncbi:MAG TPA: diacylglycerol kinase family protein [Miltoncostaeaceae bacterium]|nr:diacylglycerol kinase family protein [Miltoncostaeaceae bacterium]